MTKLKHPILCTLLFAAIGLMSSSCDVSLDATAELYSCDGDGDCIDGYVCRPQPSGESACVLLSGDAGLDTDPTDVDGHDTTDSDVSDSEDVVTDSDGASTCTGGQQRCDNTCVDLSSSATHCGTCGNSCRDDGVVGGSCDDGSCSFDTCEPNFIDLDQDPSNGCECEVNQELCNGKDDDCDGEIDEEGFAALQVEVGQYHSCAIDPQHDVYCWGQNTNSPIGDGTQVDRWEPTYVDLESEATDIAVGAQFSCAVLGDYSAWCWGDNRHGQLGDGTISTKSTPVQVTSSAAFKSIDASTSHACALDDQQGLWCWGDNEYGQLGNGETSFGEDTPVEVLHPEGESWTHVSTGSSHTCARDSANQTYCWGLNARGQLGTGDDGGPFLRPQHVTAPSFLFTTVSAGSGHTCAIDNGDDLYCWGDNSNGQLGDAASDTTVPVAIDALYQVSQVVAGSSRTCAIARNSTFCWGDNSHGELGVGDGDARHTPTQLHTTSRFVQVDIWTGHACGITESGHVRCWGDITAGRLGVRGESVTNAPLTTSCPL